ncbi:hypothetical protein HGRIS_005668 [Hohenbuehelia grisea]|uniref:Epidermal growth factor receptor-like transmembrane-juxtamembrane segment domain-containing protein n=1 Tax=Hohenbuehelia grisea TaxID=104357 RepID=A0ABR3JYF4_9AGAR
MIVRLVALFLFLSCRIYALSNVTIDDESSLIAYSGNWELPEEHQSPLSFGGGFTLSTDKTAKATFTFNGVAVYYMAPKFPKIAFVNISLDGGSPIRVGLSDDLIRASTVSVQDAGVGSPSQRSAVLWGQTGLSNSRHTLVVTMGIIAAVVDAFVITVDDDAPSNPSDGERSSSTSSSSFPASSSTESSVSSTPTQGPTLILSAISASGTSLSSAFTSSAPSSESRFSGDSSSTSTPAPSTASSPAPKESDKADASSSMPEKMLIAIAAAGGTLLLVLVASILFFCHRRRQKSRKAEMDARLDGWLGEEFKDVFAVHTKSFDPNFTTAHSHGGLGSPGTASQAAGLSRLHPADSQLAGTSPAFVPSATTRPASQAPIPFTTSVPISQRFDNSYHRPSGSIPVQASAISMYKQAAGHEYSESTSESPQRSQGQASASDHARCINILQSADVFTVREKQVVLSYANAIHPRSSGPEISPASDDLPVAFEGGSASTSSSNTPPGLAETATASLRQVPEEALVRTVTVSAPPAYCATAENV